MPKQPILRMQRERSDNYFLKLKNGLNGVCKTLLNNTFMVA